MKAKKNVNGVDGMVVPGKSASLPSESSVATIQQTAIEA
jgi:hypothetical protein